MLTLEVPPRNIFGGKVLPVHPCNVNDSLCPPSGRGGVRPWRQHQRGVCLLLVHRRYSQPGAPQLLRRKLRGGATRGRKRRSRRRCRGRCRRRGRRGSERQAIGGSPALLSFPLYCPLSLSIPSPQLGTWQEPGRRSRHEPAQVSVLQLSE